MDFPHFSSSTCYRGMPKKTLRNRSSTLEELPPKLHAWIRSFWITLLCIALISPIRSRSWLASAKVKGVFGPTAGVDPHPERKNLESQRSTTGRQLSSPSYLMVLNTSSPPKPPVGALLLLARDRFALGSVAVPGSLGSAGSAGGSVLGLCTNSWREVTQRAGGSEGAGGEQATKMRSDREG